MIPPEEPLRPSEEVDEAVGPPTGPLETSGPPERPNGEAYWDYQDLLVFVFLAIASLFASQLIVLLVPPLKALATPYKLLLGQILWYILVFGWLAGILRLRYDRPFWPSLGWFAPRPLSAIGSAALGPILAIGLSLLGALMRTPQITLPFEGMLKTPALLILFGLLVALIGPICEELAFRGFMMPLFIRSLGAVAGIVITGILFGVLHGFEYPDWRPVVLITLAGVVFGWRRYETGSTVNSMLMHAGFNLTQFVALVASKS